MGKRKYTVEELQETALLYTTRNDFKTNDSNRYKAAHSYGVIDDITKHMKHSHSRVCNKCEKHKSLKDFVKNKNCTEGHTNTCKLCYNKNQNERAVNNSNIKEARKRSSQKVKALNAQKTIEYLGGKLTCVDCGLTSTIFDVYDFHHLDPSTKKYTVSSIMDYKWETIRNELDKCALLCANCHRIRHHKEKENNG